MDQLYSGNGRSDFRDHTAEVVERHIPTRGPPASPCHSALDVVASFTTPVNIVSMHNLFLQEVVNGMVHVHVMYVCNPYVICESRFLSAGWSLGAVILLYNNPRV